MKEKTISELAQGLKAGDFSSVELTEYYLKRINEKDNDLNSYITVTSEQALEQAKQADQKISQGDAGLLTGIPLANKDIFCSQGIKTSCGSKMLDNFISPYDNHK